jgi:outer membrane protein insertion porin family
VEREPRTTVGFRDKKVTPAPPPTRLPTSNILTLKNRPLPTLTLFLLAAVSVPLGHAYAAPASADAGTAPGQGGDGGESRAGDGGTTLPASDSGVATTEATAAPAAAAGIIAGFEIDGATPTATDQLIRLLRGTFPDGSRFVESGPADRLGIPIGTLPRIRRALDAIGYNGIGEAASGAEGVVVKVHVRPYDRVRYIYVTGNGRIRQDEISRRVSIRPGRPLPLPGPDREAAVERERQRVIQFLRSEGYFDANVRIDLSTEGIAPAAVDLTIRIDRGSAYPVGPVTVTGNQTIPAPEIEEAFHHRDPLTLGILPPPFTVRQMRDDITTVTGRYRDLGYPGARISSSFDPERSLDRKNKNVAVVLRVNERKRITIAFEGNDHRSASTLRDKTTLKERGAYDDYEVQSSADAVQRFYQEHGHFFARVAWRRERIAEDAERIVFTIDEGPELKVRAVEFVGNRAESTDELSEVVTVRTFPLLGYIGLGTGGYVTARQVELDAERVVEHYRARGYSDVQAHGEISTSRETFGMPGAAAAGAETVARNAKGIYVRFTVDEGPLVHVGGVDFQAVDKGHIPYHPIFLRQSLSMRTGDAFRPSLLREDARRLERMLGDAGHAVATAEPDVERDGNAVRVIWKVKTGPRIRVGPIFVRGNFVTVDETILEQIPIRSGDYLTTTAFERGQRNLGFLQLFNNAAPISFPGKDEGQTVVPMVVEVEERYEQFNVLHLGFGISTEQAPPDSSWPVGAYARAGYDNRNLFGHGWNLTSSVSGGTSLLRANTNFLDRRFFGTLFRFDISGQYFRQATVRLGNIVSWGGSIGFSREMYPGVDAAIHYNLRNTTHTEALLRLPGASEDQKSITLSTPVGSVSLNLQWLRLDNRLVPTRGFKIEASTEIAPRSLSFGYADVSFIKVGARSTVVLPILSWLSLRHGLRYDQGFPLGNESVLPKVERYFAGGDTTLRGIKLDRARIDQERFSNGSGIDQVQYRPIGGSLRLLQNIDLQFPISAPWYGAIFMDNGVVADSFDGLQARQFRHGVGVAPLIIKLPVGDLSFAWAWPLDPGPGDTKIGVLHVNIGLMF